jgi:uncharacterized protein
MQVIRSTDYRRMPWKNGGGETAEIALSPAGATLEAFDWRVSMASVNADGPFSAFANVDRTLAIVSGAGIRLSVAGRAAVELSGSSAPYAFPADLPTTATLVAGPITDLNVMTRRGRASHRVYREVVTVPKEFRLVAQTTLLVVVSGHVRLTATAGNSATESLGLRDTLLAKRANASIHAEPETNASVLVIEIDTP